MRTLAIDLGTRRVGLALSDEGGKLATPYRVLQVRSQQHAVESILPIIQKESVTRVVVGLPLNMDGTIGPAARSTIEWADELGRRSGKPLVFVDERLSSFDAEQQIASRKRQGERITRKRKKKSLDALAAATFLQALLDGKLEPIRLPTGEN